MSAGRSALAWQTEVGKLILLFQAMKQLPAPSAVNQTPLRLNIHVQQVTHVISVLHLPWWAIGPPGERLRSDTLLAIYCDPDQIRPVPRPCRCNRGLMGSIVRDMVGDGGFCDNVLRFCDDFCQDGFCDDFVNTPSADISPNVIKLCTPYMMDLLLDSNMQVIDQGPGCPAQC